ncbi:hypothetical protein ACKAWY_20820 [Xanthomonas vasicola pv. vasculorum]|nr:hypothetical protein [Xanthomonas vasicola]MDO6957445.1 hypothetical protein [Xanthomonas vasicola]MDO6972083.1 hypothetical protein [Xanthomonas vasicola]
MRNGLEPPERALLIVTGLFLLAVFFIRDLAPLVDYLQGRIDSGV